MGTKPSRSAALVLLVLHFAACAGLTPAPRLGTVLLLHTNDLHSRLVPGGNGEGGMARIGGYVDRARAERGDVLLLDAGDGVTGTPASTIYEGRPIFSVMAVIGYDAATLGNHEFDHGYGLIADYRRIAPFPILSANAVGPDGALLADEAWRVIDVAGTRVGVIGLLTPETPALTAPGVTDGCTFLPPEEVLAKLLPEVERQSDLVVVLSHLGYEADRALAAAVPGIDVIVGGHSHTELTEPQVVGETLIVHALAHGRRIGRLELVVDREADRVVGFEGRLVTVDENLPVSRATAEAVEVWESQVAGKVSAVVGRTDRDWSTADLKGRIEQCFLEALRTDLAYMNEDGVRVPIRAGPIRVRDLWDVLPFENTLTTVRVKGAALPEWARAGGDAIDPDRVYSIATNSYVSGHAGEFFPEGLDGVEDSGLPMRNTWIEWVRARGGLD